MATIPRTAGNSGFTPEIRQPNVARAQRPRLGRPKLFSSPSRHMAAAGGFTPGNLERPDTARTLQSHFRCQKTVTRIGGCLLAALKSIKRQGWWKGKFALFQRLAKERLVGEPPFPKGDSPYRQLGRKNFYRQREGATCRNSTVSSDSHLEIGKIN